MKITVFGATGFVGAEALRQALDRQHEIKILVRSPEKIGNFQNKVEVIQGDYFNKESISKAIHGVDAIISTIGPP